MFSSRIVECVMEGCNDLLLNGIKPPFVAKVHKQFEAALAKPYFPRPHGTYTLRDRLLEVVNIAEVRIVEHTKSDDGIDVEKL